MMSSAMSALLANFDKACSVVGESANKACSDAEHCDRRSGLACGKNTLDGIPFAAGSNLELGNIHK